MTQQMLWKKRWHRAVRVALILQFLPFVRMVGLNGSMATGTFTEESDIDFFIVAEVHHLYTCRAFVTVLLTLFRLRTRKGAQAGLICLNRYSTSDFLDITEHNSYHARVFHNLIPLFATGDVYEQFQRANKWMTEYGFLVQEHVPVIQQNLVVRVIQYITEGLCKIIPHLELALYNAQLERLRQSPYAQEKHAIIVTTEQEVRLHVPKKSYV